MARFYTDTGKTIESSVEKLAGRKVRTVRELRNGNCTIPQGKIMFISYSDPRRGVEGGMALKARTCKHCGVTAVITGVGASDVILIEEKDSK